MTIKEVADDSGVDVDDILLILKSNGINGSPYNSIKDIASDHVLHPSEIKKMIKGNH